MCITSCKWNGGGVGKGRLLENHDTHVIAGAGGGNCSTYDGRGVTKSWICCPQICIPPTPWKIMPPPNVVTLATHLLECKNHKMPLASSISKVIYGNLECLLTSLLVLMINTILVALVIIVVRKSSLPSY